MRQVELKITGVVQGVFFRAETRAKAVSLGLRGWVMNNTDGSVSVLAQGDEGVLRDFVEWCRNGPDGAEVDNVEEKWGEIDDDGEKAELFTIRAS